MFSLSLGKGLNTGPTTSIAAKKKKLEWVARTYEIAAMNDSSGQVIVRLNFK